MPDPVRLIRPLVAPLAVAASLIGVTAQAQDARSGEDLGLRYLSWGGKTTNTPASVTSAAGAATDGLRRPQTATPRLQTVSAPAPSLQPVGRANRYSGAPSSIGLTPASAWIGRPSTAPVASAPAPAPAPAPMPAPTPEPTPASGALDLQPSASLRGQDAYCAAPPVAQQAMQPTPQPSQHLAPPPEVPAAEPHDPMAPRRDALIFRMGQPASAPQASTAAQPTQTAAQTAAQTAPQALPGQPPRQGARYYSVHRQAGLQPDPMVLPDSVFIGGTTDLAEPPPVATPTRLVNGRAQIMVPNADPSLP